MAFTGITTNSYGSDEIRAFGCGDDFDAIPVTLDPALGSAPAGTALGRVTATGYYAAYNDAHSDGTEVCSGILQGDFTKNYPSLTGEPMVTSMWISGAFVQSALTSGGLDAAGIADLKARSLPGRDVLIIPGA